MGVPKFFRAMLRRYPETVLRSLDAEAIDWLHLDFNGLMHPVCREVMRRHPDLEGAILEERMLDALCREVDRVAAQFRPRCGLLVAIDGPAPVAKMVQQRERRFKTMVDARESRAKRSELGLHDASSWDTNAITPGTAFLHAVAERLAAYIAHPPMDSPLQAIPTCVLTDGQVPGEGEHKLFQYIREQGLENASHLIVGLDADLIFLSSLSPATRIFLAREEEAEAWKFIDIAALRRALWEEIGVRPEDPRGMRVLEDICALGSFFGNDFLPTTYVYDLRHQGFMRLLEGYRAFWHKADRTLLNEDGRMDLVALAQLLRPFADEEAETLAQEAAQVQRRRPPPFVPDPDLPEAENAYRAWEHRRLWVPLDPAVRRIPWREAGWEDAYYRELFELHTPDGAPLPDGEVATIRRAAAARYLEGVIWVIHYYTGRLRDWHWFYPFHAAPLLRDLVDALEPLAEWVPSFPERAPLDPLQQLALVLPIASHRRLLPRAMEEALQEDLWWMYPRNARSRGFLRTQSWEFTPRLPAWPRDLRPMLDRLDRATGPLNEELRARNVRHPIRILRSPNNAPGAREPKLFP